MIRIGVECLVCRINNCGKFEACPKCQFFDKSKCVLPGFIIIKDLYYSFACPDCGINGCRRRIFKNEENI